MANPPWHIDSTMHKAISINPTRWNKKLRNSISIKVAIDNNSSNLSLNIVRSGEGLTPKPIFFDLWTALNLILTQEFNLLCLKLEVLVFINFKYKYLICYFWNHNLKFVTLLKQLNYKV